MKLPGMTPRLFFCYSTILTSCTALLAADPKPVPDSAFPQDVRVERGISYLPEGRQEKADLYFPKEMPKDKRFPAVVIIHGGGFIGGQRDAARELNIGGNLARNGYIGMSIDYLLSTHGSVAWPQNLYDCKTAVRWLRANAARLQVDVDHIGVIGGSAGGHLSAMVGLTEPSDGLDPKEPLGNVSCQVRCAVVMYGPAAFTSGHDLAMLGKKYAEAPELYRQASPLTYVRKTNPPILILHGTADNQVPVQQSHILADALQKVGVEHELVIIEGAPHSFHLQPKQRDLRPVVLGFFDRHLKAAH